MGLVQRCCLLFLEQLAFLCWVLQADADRVERDGAGYTLLSPVFQCWWRRVSTRCKVKDTMRVWVKVRDRARVRTRVMVRLRVRVSTRVKVKSSQNWSRIRSKFKARVRTRVRLRTKVRGKVRTRLRVSLRSHRPAR